MGVAYPADTDWQNEFEAEFPYEPTNDQLTSRFEEIKQDMSKARPDGSVALRRCGLRQNRAWRCAPRSKPPSMASRWRSWCRQRCWLEQHYRSFSERMADYPFTIESISRFKSAKQQKEIVKKLAAGEIDILIGTHRLISNDVKFAGSGVGGRR